MKHERDLLKQSYLFSKRALALYFLVTAVSGLRAMVFDNRWWPLYRQPLFGALAKEWTHAHGFRAHLHECSSYDW